jgi:hypothetical protein
VPTPRHVGISLTNPFFVSNPRTAPSGASNNLKEIPPDPHSDCMGRCLLVKVLPAGLSGNEPVIATYDGQTTQKGVVLKIGHRRQVAVHA